MQYTLEVPKICGETIALCKVVDVMARNKVTIYGSASFHNQTYKEAFESIGASIINEVLNGNLVVCDAIGIAQPVNDEIKKAIIDDTLDVVRKYVVEPDYEQLKKLHPEAKITDDVWDWTGIDLGKTVPDAMMSALVHFNTNLHHLNVWGSKIGIDFTLTEMPVEVINFDLTDENGNIIAKDYYRAFVSSSKKSEENSTNDTKEGSANSLGASKSMQKEDGKPHEIQDPRDPEPAQRWYTPARYFARQLVKDDSTLLLKRDLLAHKVSDSLAKVGIFKRGAIGSNRPFNHGTVKKALTNVNLG